MAAPNFTGIRGVTESKTTHFSPEGVGMGRRVVQSQHMHRGQTDSETLMPRLRPALGKTPLSSAYGSRKKILNFDSKDHVSSASKVRPFFRQDKEQLYEEAQLLKGENNQLKTMNTRLGTQLTQLEQELYKKDQLLEQLNGVTEEKQFSTLIAESHMISSLKHTIRQLRTDLQQRDQAYAQLKRNIKLTKAAELEAEAKEYMAECQRLKDVIRETKSADSRSYQKGKNDPQLVKENQDLISALNEYKKGAVSLTERLQQLEQVANVQKGRESRLLALQDEVETCHHQLQTTTESLLTQEQHLQEGKMRLEDLLSHIFLLEDTGRTEFLRRKEAESRIDTLETALQKHRIEKEKLESEVRINSIKFLKRKITRKHVVLGDAIPKESEFSVKEMKAALRNCGIKVPKAHLKLLGNESGLIDRKGLIFDYEKTVIKPDSHPPAAPPASLQSDTFSLTSNPFEIVDSSKQSGVVHVSGSLDTDHSQASLLALKHQSQPTPILIPVEERENDSEQLKKSISAISKDSGKVQESEDQEVEEEEVESESMSQESGSDLMAIAEVRRSLSCDSSEKRRRPSTEGKPEIDIMEDLAMESSSNVVLLNIDETRVRLTFAHIRMRARGQKLTKRDVITSLIKNSESEVNFEGLKARLEAVPLSVKDEGEAIAAAAYILGHRVGLMDTQKMYPRTAITEADFLESWDIDSSETEETLQKRLDAVLTQISKEDFEKVDLDASGRVSDTQFRSVLEKKGISLDQRLSDFVEVTAYAETKEIGVVPYVHFLKEKNIEGKSPLSVQKRRAALAQECAQHLSTELLVQALSIPQAFQIQGRDVLTAEELQTRISSLGLADLEGIPEFTETVSRPDHMIPLSALQSFLSANGFLESVESASASSSV